MINAILKGLFSLVIGLVNLILTPIDSAISLALPSVAEALSAVGGFFNWICSFIPYLMSWLNLPQWFLTFVIGYWTFKLTVPLVIHTVKLAIAWYDKIKP